MVPVSGFSSGFWAAVYIFNNFGEQSKYNKKIIDVKEGDFQWAYLSAFAFCYLSNTLNVYPIVYKMKVMTHDSNNLMSNMFIYKLAAENAPKSRVILSQDGAEGYYNRANRSLYHFLENSLPLGMAIAMNSYVFPEAVFRLIITLVIGRLMYTQ